MKIYLIILLYSIIRYSSQSDFLLDIDGSSLVVNNQHLCVIEYKHGVDIGGRLQCWDQFRRLEHLTPQENIFIQISGGMFFSCGITIDQSMYCWGSQQYNRQIPGKYSQVSVANSFACSIQTDGQIYCFGHSFLANHIQKDNNRYVQISCGSGHCCALDENAVPTCWGNVHSKAVYPPDEESSQDYKNDYEEEEDEEEIEESIRTSKPLIRFRQISVGDQYSCGIKAQDNDLICWGEHDTFSNPYYKNPYPRHVKGPFKQISIGQLGICAIRGEIDDNDLNDLSDYNNSNSTSHSLQCWGNTIAVMPRTIDGEWDQVRVGDGMICAVSMDSQLHCWGSRIPHLPESVIIA